MTNKTPKTETIVIGYDNTDYNITTSTPLDGPRDYFLRPKKNDTPRAGYRAPTKSVNVLIASPRGKGEPEPATLCLGSPEQVAIENLFVENRIMRNNIEDLCQRLQYLEKPFYIRWFTKRG